MSELQLECVVYIRLCRRLEDLRSISAAAASTAGVPFPHVREAMGVLFSDDTARFVKFDRMAASKPLKKLGDWLISLFSFSDCGAALFFYTAFRTIFAHIL